MSGARRPRVVVIDPSLEPEDAGRGPGHAARYAAALLNAVGERSPVVVARRGFVAADGFPAGSTIHATLPFGPHSKVTAAAELERLDERGRRRFRFEMPWAEWHRRRRRAQRIEGFARGVLPALADLRPGDTALVATGSELEAAGLARAIRRADLPKGIGFHVQFHAPLERGFAADRQRQARRLARVARLLAGAVREAHPHELRFHATTPELAAQYARLGAAPCDALPYPIVAPQPARGGRPTGAPLRASVLGDARPEKHSHRLAEVVAAVARDPALADAVTFAIQCNLGFPPASTAAEHVAVRRCLAALADDPRVESIPGPLDDSAYQRELARADVALLPYDQRRYRTRLSAILLEALAVGAVPIVTGGGWMERQLSAARDDHVASLTGARGGDTVARLPAATVPRRGIALPCTLPAGTAGLAVEVTWARHGATALAEPPLRLAVDALPATAAGSPGPGTTVVSAPAAAGPARVILPVPRLAHEAVARVLLQPAAGAEGVDLAGVVVAALGGDGPLPVSAAGVVIDDVADAPAALAEVALHADHYRRSIARAGAAVRAAHSPAALLARLLP